MAGLLAACQPQVGGPGLDVVSTRIPLELSGPCPTSADAAYREFTDEVVKLRAEIRGPGIQGAIIGEGAVESLTVKQIPAGPDRTVTLLGLNSNGAAFWRSIRRDVTVTKGQDTSLGMLMSRVADMSCPRSGQSAPRAFHTSTRLADGRVLVVGGAISNQSCGDGCRQLTATPSAEIYDPTDGTFTEVGGVLSRPRMFHTATLLENGQVLIAGGTAAVEARTNDANNPFPLRPDDAISLIELYRPATNDFVALGDDPEGARVFHAAAALSDGSVLISGGVPGVPGSGVNDLGNATASTTRCAGDPVVCSPYASMKRARAGHSLWEASDGSVVAWGGSVNEGDVEGVPGYQMERMTAGTFSMMDVPGVRNPRMNMFFAASARYLPFRMMVAGGLLRASDGTFSLATLSGDRSDEASVFVWDETASDVGGIAVAPQGGIDMSLKSPRFLAAAAPLDGKSALIVGGFSTLGFNPSSELDIFREESLTVAPLSVGGQARTLRQTRGGLSALAVGDGTVLLTGGESGLGDERAPLSTAEIFTDPNASSEAQ